MIYLIYLFIGLVIFSLATYCEYHNGIDFKISDIPFALFTFFLWPIIVLIGICFVLSNIFNKFKEFSRKKFGGIRHFVLIKGKENKQKKEEVVNEFEEDEEDYDK